MIRYPQNSKQRSPCLRASSFLLFPLQAALLFVSSLTAAQLSVQHALILPYVSFPQPLSFAYPIQRLELAPQLALYFFLSLKLPPIYVLPALSLASQLLTTL